MAGCLRSGQSLSWLLKRGSSATGNFLLFQQQQQRSFAAKAKNVVESLTGATESSSDAASAYRNQSHDGEDDVPTSGISRPLSEILKELNKKVPDSLLSVRTEPNGFSVKYIPWLVHAFFLFFTLYFNHLLYFGSNYFAPDFHAWCCVYLYLFFFICWVQPKFHSFFREDCMRREVECLGY